MRTGHKGDLSELIVLTALLRADREIALPYGNCPGYDLLVRSLVDGQWKRVQVKTAYRRANRPTVYCDFLRGSGKGKRRKYTCDDMDFLVAVDQTTNQYWVFKAEEVEGKRCCTVDRYHKGFGNLIRIA